MGVEAPDDGEEEDGERTEEKPWGRAEVRRDEEMRPVNGDR